MHSPSIHIYVEPPTEDQCAPLDLGDGPMVIDPPFDPIRVNYQYPSDPLYGSQPDYFEGFRNDIYSASGNEGKENLNNQIDLATDHRPYPFGSLQYNVTRSPTDDYSPYSSTLGDDFSPTTSPSVHGGQLSPSHSSSDDVLQSSLSPTQLNNLSLPFDELNLGHNFAWRARSRSVTERTVAPSDVWCDPAIYTGVRSAPPTTAPLPDDTSPDSTLSNDGSGYDLRQIGSGIMSPAYDFDFLTSGQGLYPDVSAEMSPGQAEFQDVGNALLFQTVTLDPPPSHKLDTQLSQRCTTRTPHRRSNSDSSGFLSPTSPVDRRSGKMHHRKAESVSGSIRHTPYPASAPSTPEQAFGVPELAGAYSARRHSGPSSSRPKLSIYPPQNWSDQVLAASRQVHPVTHGGHQAVGTSYVSNGVVDPIKNEWNQANAPSPSLQLVQGMVEQPQMYMQDQLSPSSAVSSTSPSMQKDVVGSQKIVNASTARRKRVSKFACTWANCHQTFTAKHNWTYHYLSHTGERPFPCGKCQDRFTTPGVANRHRAKCPGPEGGNKRRRSRSSTACSSRIMPE